MGYISRFDWKSLRLSHRNPQDYPIEILNIVQQNP